MVACTLRTTALEVAVTGGKLTDLELMQEIVAYNEVDCKVMMEIVRYLRANASGSPEAGPPAHGS